MSVIEPPSVVAGENNIGGEKREEKLSAVSNQLSGFDQTRKCRQGLSHESNGGISAMC